jgi:hypothetical protein
LFIDQEFQDRDNLHLDCFVEGHQPILVEWHHNDQLIMPSDDPNVEIFRESGVCSMEIISATQRHQGEYTCSASNAFGHATTSCHLKAQPRDNHRIEFTEHLQDQVVPLKSEVFLDCTLINLRKSDRVVWSLNHVPMEMGM